MPPRPCLSICLPAARAMIQDWLTLASMTSRKSSSFWSTILATLLSPPATTRMSRPPNLSTASVTILSQFSSDEGRSAMPAVLAPSFSHSAAIFFSSASLLAANTTLAPAPAKVFAASAPKAPEAPVTIAVLPLMSNRETGFFRKSSDIMPSQYFTASCPRRRASSHHRMRGDDWVSACAGTIPLIVTSAASPRRRGWCTSRCCD